MKFRNPDLALVRGEPGLRRWLWNGVFDGLQALGFGDLGVFEDVYWPAVRYHWRLVRCILGISFACWGAPWEVLAAQQLSSTLISEVHGRMFVASVMLVFFQLCSLPLGASSGRF